MKKKTLAAVMLGVLVLSAAGCGNKNEETEYYPQPDIIAQEPESDAQPETETKTEETQENTQIGNPWTDITYEEASSLCPRLFKTPDGATGVKWSKLEGSESDSSIGRPLVQAQFTLDGTDFTARAQAGASEDADISGMYYTWDVTDEVSLSNWFGGAMTATMKRAVGENETADLITWYDIEIGIAYSLSTVAPDLDGFDISAIADMMNEPANEPLADMPVNFIEEQSGKSEFASFDEIIACLTEGQGYAYIKLYGYEGDVLAVSDLVFEADNSAYFASLYMMEDGAVKYVGDVEGNGSSYPLRLEDGIIYGGDNHNYYTYWASSVYTGIMVKDYVADDISTEGNGFMGTLREKNDFDHDQEFTGGQEEFDKLMAEREKKPIIEFKAV